MIKINYLGGLNDLTPDALRRAKKADLVTLPRSITGTNCFNCKYLKSKRSNKGFCSNISVKQEVNERNCCALWDNGSAYRTFGKISSNYI